MKNQLCSLFTIVLVFFGNNIQSENHIVKMLNQGSSGIMVFEPAFLKINVGDTVTFESTDAAHNSASISGMIPSSANSWDGHWQYSSLFWKFIRGNRKWFINRYPCEKHIKLIKDNELINLKVERYETKPTFNRTKLAKTFKSISDLDRKTSGAFLQASKK